MIRVPFPFGPAPHGAELGVNRAGLTQCTRAVRPRSPVVRVDTAAYREEAKWGVESTCNLQREGSAEHQENHRSETAVAPRWRGTPRDHLANRRICVAKRRQPRRVRLRRPHRGKGTEWRQASNSSPVFKVNLLGGTRTCRAERPARKSSHARSSETRQRSLWRGSPAVEGSSETARSHHLPRTARDDTASRAQRWDCAT